VIVGVDAPLGSESGLPVGGVRLTRVHDGDSLLDLLERVCRAAVRSLRDVHWAGVTARFAGAPFTAAHTEQRVLVVDRAQYAQGDGPALTAMRTDRKTAATVEHARRRWPLLAGAAAAAGVRSFLSEPLHAGGRTVGSLNLYSDRPGGLRTQELDPAPLSVLAAYLDRWLADYHAGRPGADGATRSQSILRDRRTVHHAITVLTAARGLTAPAAAAALYRRANDRGMPVRRIADEVIHHHDTTRHRPR
jgi:hypothetical protein